MAVQDMNNVRRWHELGVDDGFVIKDERKGDKKETTSSDIQHVFSKYAERCSLNGVSFIKSSKSPGVKMVWTLLLIVAIGAMVFHLCRIFMTYFKFEKGSEITITFSDLQFPAVTICNVNPVRMSKRHLASTTLNELINAVNPEVLRQPLGASASYDNDESPQAGVHLPQSVTSRTFDDAFSSAIFNITSPRESLRPRASTRTSVDDSAVEYSSQPKTNSMFYETEKRFKEIYAAEDEKTRAEMGHKIDDMLVQCHFAGQLCQESNIRQTSSTTYGNCFSIENADYLSYRSGPLDGMSLILWIESDEYLPTISEGKGAQLVIHERGTVPFPEDEGIALAAGIETVIGIRQLEISRLGSPYGSCRSVEDFEKDLGVKYTRATCQRACQQIWVRDECECYDEVSQEVNAILKNPKGLPPCRTAYQIQCLERIENTFGRRNSECNCDSPCSEKKFDKTISLRQWPSPSFAQFIVEKICPFGILKPSCDRLRNKTRTELMHEFIKLTIFFEDLNYEKYSETVGYGLYEFISDIGGTIGLWIGLSVLSVFEVLHLFADIVAFLYRKARSKLS